MVSFFDLTNFTKHVRSIPCLDLFATMSAYFEMVRGALEGGGGVLVKSIGDAGLAVFPGTGIPAGVEALVALRRDGDEWLRQRGMPCQHAVKAHVGRVAWGVLGAGRAARHDVYGEAVNVTARLPCSAGLVLSAELFGRLTPEQAARFDERAPPITYLERTDA